MTAAVHGAAPPLWRTAVALSALYLVDVWLLRDLGGGLVSSFVAVAGAAALLVGALWAGVRGGAAMARNRTARAALYVGLGVCAVATLRLRARPLNEFHAHLAPGMTLGTVLHRLDAVYAEHPRQWIHVAIWGTSREFALEEVHEAARTSDALAVVNWHGGAPRSPAEIDSAAKALGSARQVWFTFRTATGYLQFFLALDAAGRVREVSKLTGHQA